MQTAWSRFSKVNVPAHVGAVASWLVIRSMLRNMHLDRSTKHLLVAKDALLAGALLTGVAATITGKAMKRVQAGATKPVEVEKPITKGEKPNPKEATPAPNANKEFNKLLRLEKKLGRANMAFLAGAIILSPAIAVGILRSRRMGILGRIFNR